jgi:hypothetical protein
MTFAILAGLPDEYGTLVTILEATSEKMSAKEMLPLLLQTEARLKLQGSSGSSGSSGGGSGSSVSCYRCGGAHKLTECKVSKEIEYRSRGKTGHMHAVCWKKHGKPTGAKFGGKGKPKGGEKGVAFTAHEETRDEAWILDLGCTQHLTGDKGMFKTLEAVRSRKEIEFGNKQSLATEGVGEVELRCVTPDGEQVVTLKEVYYIPGVAVNLFSVRRATEKGAEVYLSKERCYVKYEGKVVMQAKGVKGLWFVEEAERDYSFLTKEKETAKLWHRRFGHARFENLAKLAEGKLAVGVTVGAGEFRMEKSEVYEPCILAKQTRQPFPNGESESSGVLKLVHMDVCGPMEKRSMGGSRFFATFTDDYGKLSVAIPIEKKSQVVAVVRNMVARLELQSGKKLKAVRTDRGNEYVNGEMAAYFGEKGVVHQTTARYTPEQNGVAERLNRVLMERARAMLIESGLPDEMWAEAVVTANYIKNCTPVSAHGKTPWEAFYGKKPDVSHMRVFGARARRYRACKKDLEDP